MCTSSQPPLHLLICMSPNLYLHTPSSSSGFPHSSRSVSSHTLHLFEFVPPACLQIMTSSLISSCLITLNPQGVYLLTLTSSPGVLQTSQSRHINRFHRAFTPLFPSASLPSLIAAPRPERCMQAQAIACIAACAFVCAHTCTRACNVIPPLQSADNPHMAHRPQSCSLQVFVYKVTTCLNKYFVFWLTSK